MRFLDYDSPLMQFLTKVANVMIINVLTLICCLPIITIGAALTAMHYMCLKMVRNEDGYIVKGYFKAFKEAFKQATPVWLILMVLFAIFIGDFLIVYFSTNEFNYWFQVALSAMAIMVILTFLMVFPLMGKFTNTTFQTLKNALVISVVKFPITLLVIVMNVIPIIVGVFFFQLFPLVLLFGMAAPAYGTAKLLNKYFKKLEEHIAGAQIEQDGGSAVEENGDDERIFHDQLDEALASKKD